MNCGRQRICWATHPRTPNRSLKARRRVYHLEHLDEGKYRYPTTQCGMLIVEYVEGDDFSRLTRDMCMQCINQSQKWQEQGGSKWPTKQTPQKQSLLHRFKELFSR